MLGQTQIGKALDQCTTELEVEEVLSAYVVYKYLRGSTSSGVIRKLHLLVCYLCVTDRNHIVNEYADVFRIIRADCAAGGGQIGQSPSLTPIGKALFNEMRRSNKGAVMTTDAVYGGPAPVETFLRPYQSQPYRYASHYREAWMDAYFANRPNNSQSAPPYHLLQATELPTYLFSQTDGAEPILRSWDIPPPGNPEDDDDASPQSPITDLTSVSASNQVRL